MQQVRFDRSNFNLPLMGTNKEGFIVGDAVVSCCGVFDYVNTDGTIRSELRHPDDILLEESLSTLKLKPVTNDHPNELVNINNADKYAVGSVGETITVDDNGNIIASFSVTNKDAVKDIYSKRKREISLGYTLNLVKEEGTYKGKAYTHRQKNVHYNHLAIVRAGRAKVAKINMDGLAVQVVEDEAEEVPIMTDTNLQTLRVDGLEYKASPEVVKYVEKQEGLRLDAEKALIEAKANLDALQGKLDEAVKAKQDAEAKVNADAIGKLVAQRVDLLAKAGRVINTDSLVNASVRQIQEAVIKEKRKDEDLTSKNDDYVSGRFDAIIEALPSKEQEAVDKQRQQISSINKDAGHSNVPFTPEQQIASFHAQRNEYLSKKGVKQ